MFNKKIIKNAIYIVILVITLISLVKQKYNNYRYTTSSDYARIIKQGPREDKVIALTFDDGPHPIFTPKILDILKEYNVKATFFVLGKYVEMYPEIIKRQVEEGHEIGNHTFSHINANKESEETVFKEFQKTEDSINNISIPATRILRPPYGILNKKIINYANKNDYAIVLWSQRQDPKDWSNPGAEKISSIILSQTENGDVILLHDYVYFEESNTVEALKDIIPELKKRGYQFVTISELINLRKD